MCVCDMPCIYIYTYIGITYKFKVKVQVQSCNLHVHTGTRSSTASFDTWQPPMAMHASMGIHALLLHAHGHAMHDLHAAI